MSVIFFLDVTPVFAVCGIDNGRAKSVYEHLSSTFVVMDPIKKKKAGAEGAFYWFAPLTFLHALIKN